MKIRSTLILVAIFALLAGYVFLVEMKGEPEEEKPATTKILDLLSEDIVRLEVRDEAGTTVLTKDEGKPWQIVQPIQEEADQARVERIVDGLAKLGASRVVTESVADTSVYGLAEPQLTAKLTLKDGREEILLVGDKNPRGTAYYTQREGNEALYLVYASTVDDLKQLISEPPKKPTPTPMATFTPTLTATPPLTTTAAPTMEP